MIFDVNIGYGVWPFRTTVRSAALLVKHLAAADITTGWVHSMENVWNFDIDRCNSRLLQSWKKYPAFQAVPTLHEDYQQSLALMKDPAVPAGIIYPNIHGYPIASLEELPKLLTELRKPLLLPLRQEDERNQHPLAKVAPVAPGEVLELCRNFPGLRVIVLNAQKNEALTLLRARLENLYCDTAFIDAIEPFHAFAEEGLLGKLLFGSCAPLLEPLAAVMKHRDFGEFGARFS